MRHISLLLIALVIGLVSTGTAAAQTTSLQGGYGGNSDVLGEVGTVDEAPEAAGTAPQEAETPAGNATAPSSQAAAPVATSNGDLPFTGYDALFIALGGAVLLAGGYTLRRMARTHPA